MRFFFYLFVRSLFIACLLDADSTELGTTSYIFCFLIKRMKTHISEFRVLQDKGHICDPKQMYTAIQKTSLWSSKWQLLKCSQVAILLMYFGYCGPLWEFSSFGLGSFQGSKRYDSKALGLQTEILIYFKEENLCNGKPNPLLLKRKQLWIKLLTCYFCLRSWEKYVNLRGLISNLIEIFP